MKIVDLQEKRKSLSDEARSLTSQPNYTKVEDDRVNSLMNEIDLLDQQIRNLQKLDGIELGQPAEIETGNEVREMVSADGRTRAKVFEKGQSVVRNFTVHTPNPAHKVTFGQFVGSITRGARTSEERAALSGAADATGGYLVPDFLFPQIIDNLRAQSVVFQAGAKMIELQSDNNRFARIATDPVLHWRLPNIEVVASDPTFSAVTFEPKTVGGLVRAPIELAMDAPNFDALISTMFAGTFAAELDRVALVGASGSDEPNGVYNFSGLSTNYSMGGTAFSVSNLDTLGSGNLWHPFTYTIGQQLQNNGKMPNAAIMSPRTWMELSGLTDENNQPILKPEALKNLQMLYTSNVPNTITAGGYTNCSTVFLGAWDELWIGIRSGLRIQPLKERYAEYLQGGWIASMRVDVHASNDKHFSLISGVAPVTGALT